MKKLHLKKVYILLVLLLALCFGFFGFGLKAHAYVLDSWNSASYGTYINITDAYKNNALFYGVRSSNYYYTLISDPNDSKLKLIYTSSIVNTSLSPMPATYTITYDFNYSINEKTRIFIQNSANQKEIDFIIYETDDLETPINTYNLETSTSFFSCYYNSYYACIKDVSSDMTYNKNYFCSAPVSATPSGIEISEYDVNYYFIKELTHIWRDDAQENQILLSFEDSAGQNKYELLFQNISSNGEYIKQLALRYVNNDTILSTYGYNESNSIVLVYNPLTTPQTLNIYRCGYTFTNNGVTYSYTLLEENIISGRGLTLIEQDVESVLLSATYGVSLDAGDIEEDNINNLLSSGYQAYYNQYEDIQEQLQAEYERGYIDGEEWGEANTTMTPAFKLLANIFKVVGSIFSIELFPGVSMGWFIVVPLFFMAVLGILSIWRKSG